MEINIIAFVTILAYSMVVSQSFTYIIALKNVQQNLAAPAYIQVRKLTDRNFRAKFSLVMYAALVSSTLLMILCSANMGSLLFLGSLIAWLGLLIDTTLAVKGNQPINSLINKWSPDKYPVDWEIYRSKWLWIFQKRQIANIAGFISLLAGVIFG